MKRTTQNVVGSPFLEFRHGVFPGLGSFNCLLAGAGERLYPACCNLSHLYRVYLRLFFERLAGLAFLSFA
jgi:hypothetical protein